MINENDIVFYATIGGEKLHLFTLENQIENGTVAESLKQLIQKDMKYVPFNEVINVIEYKHIFMKLLIIGSSTYES